MATYDECDFIRQEGSDTCKFCGKKGLAWQETEYGWRLFEFSGVQHQCRTARQSYDNYDDCKTPQYNDKVKDSFVPGFSDNYKNKE